MDTFQTLQMAYAGVSRRLPRALAPLHVLIELTYACNLRCRFCQFTDLIDGTTPSPPPLSGQRMATIVRKLPRRALVTLTGGEPLLAPDFDAVLQAAASRNKVHIVTNGTRITMETAHRLASLACKSLFTPGLFWCGFSLHGLATTHDRLTQREGSFDATITGIQRLRSAKRGRFPRMNLQTVIQNANLSELPQVVELAHGLGIGICNFLVEDVGAHFERGDMPTNSATANPRLPPRIDPAALTTALTDAALVARRLGVKIRYQLGSPGNMVRYFNGTLSLQGAHCAAPWTVLLVAADGAAMTCFSRALGNLDTMSLEAVWKGDAMRAWRSAFCASGPRAACAGCCMLQPDIRQRHRAQQ